MKKKELETKLRKWFEKAVKHEYPIGNATFKTNGGYFDKTIEERWEYLVERLACKAKPHVFHLTDLQDEYRGGVTSVKIVAKRIAEGWTVNPCYTKEAIEKAFGKTQLD